MAEHRPVRGCDTCGQEDNHPRHVVHTPIADPGNPARVVDIGTTKHIDCCAEDGCDICALDLEHIKGKHGLALAKALQAKSEEHLTALGELGVNTVPDPEGA